MDKTNGMGDASDGKIKKFSKVRIVPFVYLFSTYSMISNTKETQVDIRVSEFS